MNRITSKTNINNQPYWFEYYIDMMSRRGTQNIIRCHYCQRILCVDNTDIEKYMKYNTKYATRFTNIPIPKKKAYLCRVCQQYREDELLSQGFSQC